MRRFTTIISSLLAVAAFSSAHAANAPISIYRYANTYDSSGWVGGGSQLDHNWNSTTQWIPGLNGFLRYKAVDFGTDTYTRFEIIALGQCIFEVRLDKLDNPAVATVKVGTAGYTGKLDTMTAVSATMTSTTGVHDVYLVGVEEPQAAYALSFSFHGTTTIAQPRTFYVSPKGSDADSGTLAKPFRTIDRAAKIMVAGDVCYLRRGIYTETLRPRNSGIPGSPIRFEAYNNEQVVISAADRLTGWQKFQGSIYRTAMSWNLGAGYNQLYADSEQIYEARFPNINTPKSVMTEKGCVNYDSVSGTSGWCWWTFPHPSLPRNLSSPVCYGFQKGTDAPMCSGGMGLEWCGSAWITFASDQAPADALVGKGADAFKGATLWKEGYFTAESGIVTGSKDVAGGIRLDLRIGYWYGSEARGFISGVLPLLDTENEWVYSGGYAYVWMPGGTDPSSVYMSAKRRTTTVDLSDRANIVLKGLHSLGGLLTMSNSRNCVVDNCDFKYISHYIYTYNGSAPLDSTETRWQSMDAGVYVSGNDNQIVRSSISYAAGAPIIVAGLRNVVEECKIHDFGYTRSRSSDILGEKCVIQRSSIYNAGRACVAIGSGNTWGANKLIYNDIYNSGLFATDGGTYYTYGPSGNYSEIAYNWWHDNYTSEPTAYMYFDGGGGTGIAIHHNVFFPHRRMSSFSSLTFSLPTNPSTLYHNTIANHSTDNVAYWYPIWEACNAAVNPACAANNLDIYDGGFPKWNFVDTVKDFHLTATSPAINAGKVLDATKFPGSTVADGKPDLGAYEFGAPDWRPGHTWGSKAWPSLTLISQDSGTTILAALRSGMERTAAVAMTPRGIELTSCISQKMTLRLFDPYGRCVASARGMGTRLAIPLRQRAGGFYIVKAEVAGARMVKKFVITRR